MIRKATTDDISAIARLLSADAHRRHQINADIWIVPNDAEDRVLQSLRMIGTQGEGGTIHHWLVAETAGVLEGVVHCANISSPPIYDLHGGTAGIILDDSHIPTRAGLANALLAEAEKLMADCGAMIFVAATPAEWTERRNLFASQGYALTTHYMINPDLDSRTMFGSTRLASDDDVSEIARLGSAHRAMLQKGNPVFWNAHPEADSRFAAWMGISLRLPDRSVLVSQSSSRIDGFIIIQPLTPIHVAAPHDVSDMALIDDFCADVFGNGRNDPPNDSAASGLIATAKRVAVERGYHRMLAICPECIPAKYEALRAQGFRPANLWMTKY